MEDSYQRKCGSRISSSAHLINPLTQLLILCLSGLKLKLLLKMNQRKYRMFRWKSQVIWLENFKRPDNKDLYHQLKSLDSSTHLVMALQSTLLSSMKLLRDQCLKLSKGSIVIILLNLKMDNNYQQLMLLAMAMGTQVADIM